MIEKQRLDIALLERGLVPSREKARGMIMAGEVNVNGVRVDKPGVKVNAHDELTIKSRQRFVSRGGDKLAAALVDFQFDVKDFICADVGASTGGFTDCLLQNGAARIYAIDVGYGILDYGLRQDPRVVVIERTNARYLETLAEQVHLVVADASFISLKLLLPIFKGWLLPKADVITLVKPQFEAGKQDVGKGGVVKDSAIHERVLLEVIFSAQELGFTLRGLTTSPLKGPAGNTEFLTWFTWGSFEGQITDVESLIHDVVNHPKESTLS